MRPEKTDFFFDQGPLARAPHRPAPEADSVDLAELLRGIWRRRLTIATTAIIGGALCFALVSQVTPRYTAMSQLLLNPRERQIVAGDQVVSDLKLSDQVMASEISIIRSNTLIEAVIRRIDTESPGALDVIDPAMQSPSALGGAKTAVKDWVTLSLLPMVGMGGPAAPEAPSGDPDADRLERLTWAIRRRTEFWREGDGYIISLAAETADPKLSQMLAGTLADAYIDRQVNERRETATLATRRIEEGVEDMRLKVEEAEKRVEDYRAQSIMEHGSNLEIVTQRMLGLNERIISARANRLAAQNRYDEMSRLIELGGYEALGNMVTSPNIEELTSERLQLLAQDARWAQDYDTRHPERQRLLKQIDAVEASLDSELKRSLDAQRNEVEIARINETTLRDSLDEVEDEFLSISRSNTGLQQLERQASAARKTYEGLLARYSETWTQEKFQQADAQVIEHATMPGAPSAPRPKLMTMLGLMLGGLGGFAWVVFRQLTAGTYRAVRDLETDTGLPVISVIPEGSWRTPGGALRAVARGTGGRAAEGIRALRTKLALSGEDRDAQSIIMLSARAAEGKTTTALMLAAITESADKLVAVIDMDLRENALQSEFRWNLGPDLGDLIQGDCGVLDALHTDTGLGFDVLVARRPRPDLTERIGTDWLRGVLDELSAFYDVIIVNAPAVLDASDAVVMARAVDRQVMVVRHGVTPRSTVQRALSILDQNGIRVAGHVLTRADPASLSNV